MIRKSILCSLSTLAAIASQGVAAQADDALFNASKPLEIVDQGTFSIPGRYVKADEHTIMVGADVRAVPDPEKQDAALPDRVHPRRRPDRGELSRARRTDAAAGPTISSPTAMRSIWSISPDAAARDSSAPPTESRATQSVEENVSRLTDTKHRWPQDGLHTQWPGAGKPGDPAFDDFRRPAWKASATSS